MRHRLRLQSRSSRTQYQTNQNSSQTANLTKLDLMEHITAAARSMKPDRAVHTIRPSRGYGDHVQKIPLSKTTAL
jgi:hypothetical protein